MLPDHGVQRVAHADPLPPAEHLDRPPRARFAAGGAGAGAGATAPTVAGLGPRAAARRRPAPPGPPRPTTARPGRRFHRTTRRSAMRPAAQRCGSAASVRVGGISLTSQRRLRAFAVTYRRRSARWCSFRHNSLAWGSPPLARRRRSCGIERDRSRSRCGPLPCSIEDGADRVRTDGPVCSAPCVLYLTRLAACRCHSRILRLDRDALAWPS